MTLEQTSNERSLDAPLPRTPRAVARSAALFSAAPQHPLRETRAVVLCGGRGSRLGALTEELPKPLVHVHEHPLLWYVVLTLKKHGFRRLVFPLGYKGEKIRAFLEQELADLDLVFECHDTGADASIGARLAQVTHGWERDEDFFLVNGDTFFDFDVLEMYRLHRRRNALLTLSSVEIRSQYGLIVEEQGRVVGFERDQRVASLALDRAGTRTGYVNAGLVWLKREALEHIDLAASKNFEQELYPRLIALGRVAHQRIDGHWFPVDTAKDLSIINGTASDSRIEIGEIVKTAKKDLASRYSYSVRYVPDVQSFWRSVLDKTVVPHQVEVQPGPEAGKEICWLKCPYCYGGSAKDSGERLKPERYIQLLQEIAEGGVKKIVFAGYATDPLNYGGIDDLLQVAHDAGQVFGFHTKALRYSERFLQLLTSPTAAPLSYFSVSVDAGSNATYNRVHGVPTSSAKLYDKVLKNLWRISEARARHGSPLDLSATYLINGHNGSPEEILKSIEDLRAAGVDLVRFTFPQVPRGYGELREDDPNILRRPSVLARFAELKPLIQAQNRDGFQVLIMDLDAESEGMTDARSLPCFARFVFPSIGFDGWLSHCSESAAPHFRELALGNLAERNFWDVYYDYDPAEMERELAASAAKMCKTGCRCDRKEHIVNQRLQSLGLGVPVAG
jgi:glucose-1-phosphate cytidylyltransferase